MKVLLNTLEYISLFVNYQNSWFLSWIFPPEIFPLLARHSILTIDIFLTPRRLLFLFYPQWRASLWSLCITSAYLDNYLWQFILHIFKSHLDYCHFVTTSDMPIQINQNTKVDSVKAFLISQKQFRTKLVEALILWRFIYKIQICNH